jgi:hypothetical protein
MKYFKIKIKSDYDNERIASDAEGDKIPNAEEYFYRIKGGDILINPPIFDYFYLESFDLEKYWEWALFDVHRFIGEGSQIPGWLISNKLKNLIQQYDIAQPYYLYPSKLLYKSKKYDYFIFHFAGKGIYEKTVNGLDYTKSIFFDPFNKRLEFFKDIEEYSKKRSALYDNFGDNELYRGIKKDFIKKRICLHKTFDFFPMKSFLTDNLASERLKNAIEENGITGFEFSDLDYEVVVEK